MDHRKCTTSADAPPLSMLPLKISNKAHEKAQYEDHEKPPASAVAANVDIDLREIYFLIMHFLSAGPCQRTFGQLWNELLEHQLLPRRYHAWFSRNGVKTGDENDDGISFPLSYNVLVDRYPHIGKDHLVKLLKQLISSASVPSHSIAGLHAPNAADVPTLLGTGSFSLLDCNTNNINKQAKSLPVYLNWPHLQADQVRGLSLREIGGGYTKHHRAPSIRAACYAIAKLSSMVQKMENIKKLRGHRDAVYCAIFDRSGRYVITGSDDRLVKVWSMETAFCLASCRGHEGDITDLAVTSNNTLVASASNDFSIRVWRLPDGCPISVLRGHTGAVTAIAFSPRPSSFQLLSSSDDGTCRIWDARSSQYIPRIYLPKPPDAALSAKSNGPSSSNGSQQSHQILCCAYNANGSVFVTGSSDTKARVWNAYKYNVDGSEQPIHEMDVLSGHENDVNYVQFSGCAVSSRCSSFEILPKEENLPKFKNSWFRHDNIVTCSRDGSAIIWISRSRSGKVARWTQAYHLKVPPPPMPPQPPRGGPRQRLLPTPRGVNMIVWSLDNRFVLAAIMDCRICVWNAVDGSLVHSLTGHTESTYVLDVHPFNPRIAMSAGYDGKTIVWDIWEGTPIRIYELGRFKLVDGKFSPDGTSIVLSDDVGQIYFLNTGQGESQKDARYDQFFLGDYRPLIRDTAGNVIDQETQLAPYRRNIQDLLCDSSMIPYPEPYQGMYQHRRLGALGIEWRPPSIKFAIGTDISLGQDYHQMVPLADLDRIIEPMPEFLDAMYWEPENEIISEDNDSEYNGTEEYSSDGELVSLSANSSTDPECSAEDSEMGRDGLRRSRRKKHLAEVDFTTSSGRRVKKRNLDECNGSLFRSNKTKKSRVARRGLKRKSSQTKSLRPQRVATRQTLTQIAESSLDGEDGDFSEEGDSSDDSLPHDSNGLSGESTKNLKQKRPVGDEASSPEDVVDIPKPLDSQENVGQKRLILRFSLRDCNKTNDLGSSSKPPQDIIEACLDGARNEVVTPAEDAQKSPVECSTIDDAQTRENALGVSCNGNHDSQELGKVASTSQTHELKENPKPKTLKLRIKSKGISKDPETPEIKFVNEMENPTKFEKSSEDYESGYDAPDAETNAIRRTRSMVMKASSQETNVPNRDGDWLPNSKMTTRSRSSRSKQRSCYNNESGSSAACKTNHEARKVSWLMLSEHEVAYRYIPQKGDEVVYLRQGHQEYLETIKSAEDGPWRSFKGNLSAVETCRVEALDYAQHSGSGEGCCKITLKFVDPYSGVLGKTFKLTLLELVDFPDFIVEKMRYDASIEKNWTTRDKCLVWWKNANGEGGSWWEGRVVGLQDNSSEFPGSPWERCVIQYKSDPMNHQFHSPWELHDHDFEWEYPRIDADTRNFLLSLFDKLDHRASREKDHYGMEILKRAAQKVDFLNKFPVPLSPELIKSRLKNDYYRNEEAAKHDIKVMLSIAQSYFIKNAECATKMRRLSDWFTRKLGLN